MKKELTQTEKAWREGYDLGVRQTLRDNEIALKIGQAILTALDDRYEFKHEDY